jgi:type IV secretion system protein TrbL
MDSVAVSIFNQLLGQYNGSISAIQMGSIEIAKELFNAIALISVAVLGINRLLSKNVDLIESNIELIKLLIYLNVFYLFISQYDQFLPLIFNSFRAAGIYMGSKASGYVLSTNPGEIINIGVSIASKVLSLAFKHTTLANIGLSLIAVVAAGVVLYCFGVIAIELILIDIGSRIILAGGILLLAFAGSIWTREYAEHYVHTFFHIGVKMLFIYVLVGIGAGLTRNWSVILDNVPIGQIMEYYVAVIMASFVYYKICQKLPDQAVVYFTGRLSMNYDTASSVNAVVKDTVRIAKGIVGGIPGIVGMSKAVSTANQAARTTLESQGKKENLINAGWQTIKTLGAASTAVKQEEWDRKVNDSEGGKIAKNITDSISNPEKSATKDIKDDAMDYSI